MDVRRFLGGHPLAVVVRLALISVLVGIVLSFLGITPRNFFTTLDNFIRHVYDLGFGAVRWLLEYLALGAMVVIPVWLLVRVLRSGDRHE